MILIYYDRIDVPEVNSINSMLIRQANQNNTIFATIGIC